MLTRPIPRSTREPKRLRSAPRARPSREVLESAPVFDRDYWLRHCEGFKVEAADGAIGFVDEVSSAGDLQPRLHVRAGLFGRRVLVVPAKNVAFIVPRAERLWLASPVQIIESRQARS
jgi:hypothetical protein